MTRGETSSFAFVARPSLMARIVLALSAALIRQRERQSLAHLDAHLLRDIGLTPDDVRHEVSKPFWQP
jgi:uncharacterized protein YjiS (DUF1127 family)